MSLLAFHQSSNAAGSSLLESPQCDSQRFGLFEDLDAGVDSTKFHEPARVLKVLVEDGQVAPWRVVGNIAPRRVDTGGCVLCRKPLGQVADLLGPVVILKRQRDWKKGNEIPRCRAMLRQWPYRRSSTESSWWLLPGRLPARRGRATARPRSNKRRARMLNQPRSLTFPVTLVTSLRIWWPGPRAHGVRHRHPHGRPAPA